MSTEVIKGRPCFGGKISTVDYTLPCPSIEQFAYTANMGVLRTAVATGHARQRRLHLDEPRTYELSWIFDTGGLHAWENFAQRHGYYWHFIPMVTGQVPVWFPVEHPVRFINDYQVNLLQEDLWEVTVQAEQYVLDQECMFNLLCDKLRACLTREYPYLNPDWAGFSAAVGTKDMWGAPNG